MNIQKITGLCLTMIIAMGGVANADSLGIGAGTQGSQNYAVNTGMAKFLNEKAGMDVRVQAYGGSGQSMPLIDGGRLDIQLVPSPDIQAAVAGEGPFKGKQLNNLRVLASLSSSAYGFMVRKDSSYHNVSDIKGLSITFGYSAQPTLALQVEGILAAGGLSINDMKLVKVPSVPNGVDEFIAGAADVAFFALQGGKTRQAEAAVGVRWLAVDNTPEAELKMKKFVPTSYIKVVQPGPSAVGVAVPTAMMGYDYVLTAGAHVSDETVQKILAAFHDKPEDVRAIRSTFAGFEPAEMDPEIGSLTYHPGAIAYYKKAGMKN